MEKVSGSVGLMKVSAVAERLNASESFVRAAIADGRLKHYRLGRAGLRVSEAQLVEFLAATEKGGSQPAPESPPRPVKLRHLSLD